MTTAGSVKGEASAARDTTVVALLTLLSRLTGFARVVTIAAVLGVNRFTDLYQSINLLPNYAHELLTGSLVTALLVPPLVRHLDAGDTASMRRLAGGFLTLVAAAGMVLMLLVILAGSFVVRLLTLGVDDPIEQADLLRLGWPLVALLMPQVMLYATAATGASVQHASGRFALAAAAPLVENVVILLVLGLWAGLFGTGIESIAGIDTSHVVFLGLGTTTAVLLHAGLQWIGAARCGVVITPRAGWRDPEVQEVVRLAGPSALYTALNVGRLGVFLVAAGLVTGGQSAFLIALNFFNLPVALGASPITTTAMPVLSRLRSDASAFAKRYLRSMSVMLLLVVPAAALMVGLARPIALMALWGSGGSEAAVVLLTAAVATTALAIPAESIFILSTSASYAKTNATLPLQAMFLRTAVGSTLVILSAYTFASEPLSQPRPGWHLLAAIGIAMAWADICGAGYLAGKVMAGQQGLGRVVGSHLPVGLLIAIATGTTTFAIGRLMGSNRLMAMTAIVIALVIAVPTVAVVEIRLHGGSRIDVVGISKRGLSSAQGIIAARRSSPDEQDTDDKDTGPEVATIGPETLDPETLDPETPDSETPDSETPDEVEALQAVTPVEVSDTATTDTATTDTATPDTATTDAAAAAPGSVATSRLERRSGNRLDLVGRRTGLFGVLLFFATGAGALAVAAAAGSATAAVGLVVPGLVAGLALFALIMWRPLTGALTLLLISPFVVGLGRGAIIPFLRLNEALLFAVAAAIAVHVMYRWSRSDRVTLAAGGVSSVDWAIGLLVLAATVIPLLVRYGRGLPISLDDAVHTVVFVKFGLLYLVFRFVVRSADDVRRCLTVSMVASVPVAALAIAQSMQLPGIATVLDPWVDGPASAFVGRGAGTIGNSGALGDLMALHLGLALMLLIRHLELGKNDPVALGRARWFGMAALVFAVGGLGSGQFSGFAATLITVVVVVTVAGRPRALLGLPVLGSVAVAAVWPVIARRIQGFDNSANLPTSWQVRISNVQDLVLPELRRDFNWALGVRPDTSIDTPLVLNGETFIESGVLWLVWAGGLVLLSAFVLLMVIAFRRFRAAAQADDPWLAAAGAAGLAATCFVAVLTTVDPHITLRGFADVFYPVLAMSLVAAAAPVRAPNPAMALALPPIGEVGWFRYSYLTSTAKRLLDLAVSATLLICLAPVLLAIAIAIKVTSQGPALFRQTRVGFAERPFTILKFRTMYLDNDEAEHRAYVQGMLRNEISNDNPDGSETFKLVDDDRITPLGKILRRLSLDELPQLVNVLRGDMSLVGPRPSLSYELTEYTVGHRVRAACVPGMTGLWQVAGRSNLHMRDALELDIRYAETCSLWTDVSILVRTVGVVAKGSGS